MTEQLKDEDRISHMLEAALKATEFAKGQDRSALDADEKLTLSLVHLLEILGMVISTLIWTLSKTLHE